MEERGFLEEGKGQQEEEGGHGHVCWHGVTGGVHDREGDGEEDGIGDDVKVPS